MRIMAILIMFLSGCNMAQRRADNLMAIINGMGGQDKDAFILRFGVPSSCAVLSSGEVCEWSASLGNRGGTTAIPWQNMNGQTYAVTSINNSHQAWEKISVRFNSDHKAIGGRAMVQY